MINIDIIILAAGKGSRMNSSRPKVLQKLSGISLLAHVLVPAKQITENIHVVYGYKGDLIRYEFKSESINWVEQADQLGTGHAVARVMPYVDDNSISLILYGDVPLIKKSTLDALVRKALDTKFSLLSVILDDPSGYGRIIRDNNIIQSIVEHKDANNDQLEVCEVNTGIMAVNSNLLKCYIDKLNPNNSQGEFYLTDVIEMAVKDNVIVSSVITDNEFEVAGINDKKQLSALEEYMTSI